MLLTDEQKIEKILKRGVERIFPNEDFLRAKLKSGKVLSVYLGIDPTGPTLHMGHVIVLRKLAQFQELGHKIILLIGDFTARIGDPDKKEVRKALSKDEVIENAKRYKEQASRFLRFDGENPAEFRYNSEWLEKMSFEDVVHLSSQMTVQRMLDRDMFRRRMQGGNPIYIHEFLYPLMQGYDSIALDVDGEVGGNDQTFNMLVGRDLMKNQNPPKEKFVLPMKLLVDKDGNKMGKTTGNMISFLDSADSMFKKIMTWPDENILLSFELLTDRDLSLIEKRLSSEENPRDIKLDLAFDIVSSFYGEEDAIQARERWIHEVKNKEIPKELKEIELREDLITTLSYASQQSKSSIRRLLRSGAIKVNGRRVENEQEILKSGDIVHVGKKQWFKIKASQ